MDWREYVYFGVICLGGVVFTLLGMIDPWIESSGSDDANVPRDLRSIRTGTGSILAMLGVFTMSMALLWPKSRTQLYLVAATAVNFGVSR